MGRLKSLKNRLKNLVGIVGMCSGLALASFPKNLVASPVTSWSFVSQNIPGSTWYLQSSALASFGYDVYDIPWSDMPDQGHSQWIKAFSSPYSEPLAWDARPEGYLSGRLYLSAIDKLGTGFVATNSRINFNNLEGNQVYSYTLYENENPLFSGSTSDGQSSYFNFDSSKNYRIDFSPVPEPNTIGLLARGLGAFGLRYYIKRRKQSKKTKKAN